MQSRVFISLSLLSALAITGCSTSANDEADKECGCEPEEEYCSLSEACEGEIQATLTGCDTLDFTVFQWTSHTDNRFRRPAASQNHECTTWLDVGNSLSFETVPPVFHIGEAPKRCSLSSAQIPFQMLELSRLSGFYVRQDDFNRWFEFIDSHCQQASDFGRDFVELGDPCLASCVPGTLCDGSVVVPFESECIACTEAPCEGFFHSAFCQSGGQLKDADLVTSIFNRLGVEMDPQTGMRQLLQEVMTCQAPFEITLRGAQSSVHFLRGLGVVDLHDGEFRREAPDRGLTWAKLREDDAETLYLCDFAETETIWQSLTLDDDGQVSNFDALKDAWLPHCEEHVDEIVQGMAAGHTCLNASTDGYRCASGLECVTDDIETENTADRIGFCRQPAEL